MSVKLPPPEKIYEAWSAIASGRLMLLAPPENDEGEAEIVSSNGKKRYKLRWDGDIYESTDSATWWQGYPGYPVIALLMKRLILPYDQEIAVIFANVDWYAINRKARNNYALALKWVYEQLDLPPEQEERIRAFAAQTQKELENLNITVRRYRLAKKAANA